MTAAPTPTRPSAWHVVLAFGVVSLFADMVYEGARSLYGPALVALGASAAVVGLVTGAGEAMALVLRLVAGPLCHVVSTPTSSQAAASPCRTLRRRPGRGRSLRPSAR